MCSWCRLGLVVVRLGFAGGVDVERGGMTGAGRVGGGGIWISLRYG
jgi:hypothetical protein